IRMSNRGADIAGEAPRQNSAKAKIRIHFPNGLRRGDQQRAVKTRAQPPNLFIARYLMRHCDPLILFIAIEERVLSRNPESIVFGESRFLYHGENIAFRPDYRL